MKKKKIMQFFSVCIVIVIIIIVANLFYPVEHEVTRNDFDYLDINAETIIENDDVANSTFGKHDGWQKRIDIVSSQIAILNGNAYVFGDAQEHNTKKDDDGKIEEEYKNEIVYLAKIVKKSKKGNYTVRSFSSMNNNTAIERPVSYQGSGDGKTSTIFGKVYDKKIKKVDFYSDGFLMGTYYIGNSNFYLLEFEHSNYLKNSVRFYDENNNLVYELF